MQGCPRTTEVPGCSARLCGDAASMEGTQLFSTTAPRKQRETHSLTWSDPNQIPPLSSTFRCRLRNHRSSACSLPHKRLLLNTKGGFCEREVRAAAPQPGANPCQLGTGHCSPVPSHPQTPAAPRGCLWDHPGRCVWHFPAVLAQHWCCIDTGRVSCAELLRVSCGPDLLGSSGQHRLSAACHTALQPWL